MNTATPKPEGCYFDLKAAERVKTFIETFIKHSRGQFAGKPFILLEWQWEKIIKPLFGWKRANGKRLYKKAWIELPKKQGKSCLASALSLYMLVGDGEQGGQCFLCSNDIKQAGIVFNEAELMARKSPTLSEVIKPVPSRYRLDFPKTNSFLRALAADGFRQEGIDASFICFDEVHSFKNRQLWDSLSYATAARENPIQLAITTAGVFDPESLGWTEHQYALDIIKDTTLDPSYLAVIYAADKDDDISKPETWYKANPSLGVTISEESFKEDYERAINQPRDLNKWRRYRLNQWTECREQWIQDEIFMACSGDLTIEELREENKGKLCYAGLDLSKRSDMTAITLVFPKDDDTYDVISECFLPKDNIIKKESDDRVSYTNWTESGLLTLTDGNVIDYRVICQRIIELSKEFNIIEIAYDRACSTYLLALFNKFGVIDNSNTQFIEYGQGMLTLGEPTKQWEMLIRGKKIRHAGNPILRWQNNNVVLDDDKVGNIMIHKGKSNHGKVDALVCAIMALGRIMVSPQNDKIEYMSFI